MANSSMAAGRWPRTLTIRNGRIASVGKAAPVAPDARTIDLGGRTVVPGLFDAHVHYTRAGVNPGYEARRIERAFSIAELQEAIAERAKSVPPGQFITCIGGWNHTQFARGAAADEGGTGRRRAQACRLHLGHRRRNGRDHEHPRPRVLRVEGRHGRRGHRRRRHGGPAVAALQAAQTPEDKLRGTAGLERSCQQARTDRRDQRRQSRRSGARASPLAGRQAHHSHAAALPGGLAAAGRDARSSTTSAREAAPSATTCSASPASASASAGPTRCRRSSSRRRA